MKRILFTLLFAFSLMYAEDESQYYSILKNANNFFQIEKEFIAMLKPSNPDDLRTAGYIKFDATIIVADKSALKELESKLDIVRSIVIDVVSGYLKTDLQSRQGREKFATELTASVNAILTDSSIIGFVFPNIVIQP